MMVAPEGGAAAGTEHHAASSSSAAASNAIASDESPEDRGTASSSNKNNNNNNNNGNTGNANGNNGDDDVDDTTYFPEPDLATPSLFETLGWWAEFASVHGVYYALERGHFAQWKRAVWGFVVAVAAGGLIWALVAEFQDFLKYSVSTSTETVIPSSLPFPQVTICNTNMFDSNLQNVTGIQEPRNEEELGKISQPFENFILYTQFNGRTYDDLAKAWTPVYTPFGMCYNFSTSEEVFVPGLSAGLNVYTWLNQSSYDDGTGIAGIHVFVSQRGSPVTEQTPNVLVPPGAASFVSAALFEFRRERDEPWKNCHGSTPMYSNELCRADCINAATVERCGCRRYGDNSDPGVRYCNSTDAECKETVGADDIDLCENCAVPPCEEEVYVTRYSAARVAEKATALLEGQFGLRQGQLGSNFVRVVVNYDAIRYERTTETKSTSVAQLISNLGGSFGFFMGISMISILEIFVELVGLRLVPRVWGDRRLYGIGQKRKFD